MDFGDAFDGVICIDAMENACPEDWPGILRKLREALRPRGVFCFVVDLGEDYVEGAYQRAKVLGLPVVFGGVADKRVRFISGKAPRIRPNWDHDREAFPNCLLDRSSYSRVTHKDVASFLSEQIPTVEL
jgi:hypothetical protein